MTAGNTAGAASGASESAATDEMPAETLVTPETPAVSEGAAATDEAAPSTGLGVDIVEIGRMEQVLERSPLFATRNFTEAERAYCERHRRPAVHYATHFAAKEAVLKALGTGFGQGCGPTDVEISHEQSGRPVVVLHGRAKELAAQLGVTEIPLSLSRSKDTAVANAAALTRASRPVVEEKKTPRQELAERFRELRGLLDEMERGSADADEGDFESEDGLDAAEQRGEEEDA